MQYVEYFDGITTGNQMVTLYCNDRGISLLSMNDPSQVISFHSYADCTAHLMYNKMVIYLKKNSNQFIIVNTGSPFFETLRTQIDKANLPWHKKIRKIKAAWLIIGIICLIIGFYWVAVQTIPLIALKFVSKDQEIALGNQLNQVIIAEKKIDRKRTKWINDFASELKLSSSYPIKITVVEEKEVNAFALPGGHIIVHTGILENMHSSNELAALLGHETAHVNLRHSLKSIISATTAGILISLVLSDASSIIGTLVENADFLRTMHYSRGLESAADEEGMKILVRNQIDPIAMHRLMKDLKEANEELPAMMSFLSSHPTTDERMKQSLAFAKKYRSYTFQSNQSLDSIWLQLQF